MTRLGVDGVEPSGRYGDNEEVATNFDVKFGFV